MSNPGHWSGFKSVHSDAFLFLCQAFNYKYSIFAHQVRKGLRAGPTLRK